MHKLKEQLILCQQCDCCELEFTEQIFKTMPDISIVYKLHLESRFDQINIYDWLQVNYI